MYEREIMVNVELFKTIFAQAPGAIASTRHINAQRKGPNKRKGWWKPLISGLGGGAIGATVAFGASGGNPAAIISGAITGANKGYEVHETIRKEFNVPWLGKKKGRVSKRKRKVRRK